MSKHNNLGKKGEELACSHISLKGYNIVERNWRYKKDEIDIIDFGVKHRVNYIAVSFARYKSDL